MNRFALMAASAALALTLTACQGEVSEGEEASAPEAAPVALVAPTTNDDEAWKAYLGQVIGNNTDGITGFLPVMPATPTITFSKIGEARATRSAWPFVIGSKVPGYRAMR